MAQVRDTFKYFLSLVGSCMVKEDLLLFQEVFYANNPLLGGLKGVQVRIARFKEQVKDFYSGSSLENMSVLNAVRSGYDWPEPVSCSCGMFSTLRLPFSRVHAVGPGLFERPSTTPAPAATRPFNLASSLMRRIFDAAYFREMMRESRARAKKKREEVKRLLAGSRSGALLLMEEPCLESIPGLARGTQ